MNRYANSIGCYINRWYSTDQFEYPTTLVLQKKTKSVLQSSRRPTANIISCQKVFCGIYFPLELEPLVLGLRTYFFLCFCSLVKENEVFCFPLHGFGSGEVISSR